MFLHVFTVSWMSCACLPFFSSSVECVYMSVYIILRVSRTNGVAQIRSDFVRWRYRRQKTVAKIGESFSLSSLSSSTEKMCVCVCVC